MKYTQLSVSYSISKIIKGNWQLAGGHGKVDKGKAIEEMFKFVEAGITTFDCADIYIGVEEMIGDFLLKYKNRYGKKNVSKIKIHTKYVPDLSSLGSIVEEDVEFVIDRSLKRLRADYLDLVQFHWWDYDVPRYVEVAHHLKSLQRKGKIKHIGVTNFDVAHLRELIENRIPVISNQVQYSVLDHRAENGMVKFCQKNNIKLLCYGTAAGGFLSEKYLDLPEPREPLENRSLVKYKLIIDDFGGYKLFQELLRCLDKIAKKHCVSLTNVAGRYILQKSQVAGIIIGARNADQLQDNLKIFSFNLNGEDIASIEEIVKKSYGPIGDVYSLERIKNGKHATIMKYNLNKV